MGRSEQVDVGRGVSSSYACQNCCSDSYHSSTLSPGGGEVEADASLDFDVWQQNKDCYGTVTAPYPRTVFDSPTSWSSSDTGTATVSSDGVASAIGAGETTIKATWTDYRYDARFAPCFYLEQGATTPQCYDCNRPLTVQPRAVLQ